MSQMKQQNKTKTRKNKTSKTEQIVVITFHCDLIILDLLMNIS